MPAQSPVYLAAPPASGPCQARRAPRRGKVMFNCCAVWGLRRGRGGGGASQGVAGRSSARRLFWRGTPNGTSSRAEPSRAGQSGGGFGCVRTRGPGPGVPGGGNHPVNAARLARPRQGNASVELPLPHLPPPQGCSGPPPERAGEAGLPLAAGFDRLPSGGKGGGVMPVRPFGPGRAVGRRGRRVPCFPLSSPELEYKREDGRK